MARLPRVVFFGTPEFAAAILARLIEAGYPVPLVVTQPDKPAGRSGSPQPSPVARLADITGLTCLKPSHLAAVRSDITRAKADVLVVAAYGRILPAELLRVAPHGAVNVHASLLPLYRGAAPIQQAILDGQEKTGVSLILLDEGLDTGPILAQASTPIAAGDTAATLGAKLATLGGRLLTEKLAKYVAGKIPVRPQDAARSSLTKPLTKQSGRIDWNRDAVYLARFVRARQPWPGAWAACDGTTLQLKRVHVDTGQAPPGQWQDGPPLRVGTGQDLLVIDELQPAGKSPMAGADWLRGQRPPRGRFS